MIETLSDHYLNNKEPNKSCLLVLRSIILNLDDNVSETMKYGMPCFCYKKKTFCYLWIDNKINEPYILLVEGKYLDHPQLEKGNRLRMKILRVNASKDIEIDMIKFILNNALDLYRNGIIAIK